MEYSEERERNKWTYMRIHMHGWTRTLICGTSKNSLVYRLLGRKDGVRQCTFLPQPVSLAPVSNDERRHLQSSASDHHFARST